MVLKQRKNKAVNGSEKDKHKREAKSKTSTTSETREASQRQISSQALMLLTILSFTVLAVSVIFSRSNDNVVSYSSEFSLFLLTIFPGTNMTALSLF